MELKYLYEPILRKKVTKVTHFDDELKNQALEMLEIMKSKLGLGLSANQVGLDKQMIVLGYQPIDDNDEIPQIPFQILCNPQIVKASQEKETVLEGCLSFPGLEVPVNRSIGVTIMAQKLDGKPIKIKAKGLYARVLQHEIDHLNGVLFTDYLTDKSQKNNFDFCQTIFFGSDQFSWTIFNAIYELKLPIIGVITETSKPSGRGKIVTDPIMKTRLSGYPVPVYQPKDNDEILDLVKRLKPQLIILASYGKIISQSVLDLVPYGSLNVHPSLLPKYRGATPLQSAILNGEKETGVTIQRMSAKVDQGDILISEKLPISSDQGYQSLSQSAADLGAKLVKQALFDYLLGQLVLEKQNDEQATLTKKIVKEMAEIDWSNPAEKIVNQIRAFEVWPVSFTYLSGRRLLIRKATLLNEKLLPEIVQLEGKKQCNWRDFVRGYSQELTKASWYDKIHKDVSN